MPDSHSHRPYTQHKSAPAAEAADTGPHSHRVDSERSANSQAVAAGIVRSGSCCCWRSWCSSGWCSFDRCWCLVGPCSLLLVLGRGRCCMGWSFAARSSVGLRMCSVDSESFGRPFLRMVMVVMSW